MENTSKLLECFDWNLVDAPTSRGIHSIHPYPAKFIPEIPRQLMEAYYPSDSSPILDPFCGSGTTLVEAVDKGIEAWGIDLNPIACLIARVKTTPLPMGFEDESHKVLHNAKKSFNSASVQIPYIPRLDHWFKHDVQQALATLVDQISQVKHIAIREALELALSRIIVRVSNQESNTRYAAIEKDVSAKEVFNQFKNACLFIGREVSAFSNDLFRKIGKAVVINRDINAVMPQDLPSNVGLVITSPPYPNAYEYWLYHKYRMYWLGMDPISVREKEIGARPHYFKKNHQDENDFEKQMCACFQLLRHVMKPQAKACFLVGRSIIHGRVIDNAAIIRKAGQVNGFVVQDIIERTIPSTRKAFNPSHSKINKEHIIVLSKESYED